MVATILSIISIICVGISIGFTLWARHDEKKIKQSRRVNDKCNNADNDSNKREK